MSYIEFFVLCPSHEQKLSRLCHVPTFKTPFEFNGIEFFGSKNGAFARQWLPCLCFFNGGDSISNSGNEDTSLSKTSLSNSWNGRQWTNALLTANVL